MLGCHLRTSAKHRSLAAYRVRAWPGADARWQAPPKPSWPGLAAEGHGMRLCSSAHSSFGVVVMMAKPCTFSFGTDTGSKVVRQDQFENQRVRSRVKAVADAELDAQRIGLVVDYREKCLPLSAERLEAVQLAIV